MLCGLLTPDGGEGTCLGYDILRETGEIKRHVGYMTQRFSLWEDLTIRENLRFVARMYGMDDVEAAGRRGARAARPRRRAQPARRRALRRLEAAARARRLHAARARSCCCSTSRPPASIRRRGATSGRSCTRSPRAASRCWSARTTWTRPSAATSSPTSSTAGCSRRARRSEVVASQSLVHLGGRRRRTSPRSRSGCAALPGVEQVAAFGATLHVTGADAARARRGARARSRPSRGPAAGSGSSPASRTCSST